MTPIRMSRAFTLLELLVVVAIMGLLGTVAIGGYSGITRGMTNEGARKAADGIAEIALRRAQIDQCTTYLCVYTEVMSPDTDERSAVVRGYAVAIRGSGRFSAVSGNFLLDEFSDRDKNVLSLRRMDGSPMTDDDYEKRATRLKLYKMDGSGDYAVVRDFAKKDGPTEEFLDSDEPPFRRTLHGFLKEAGGASFKVGEEYGEEFAAIRLPNGYTFASAAKSTYSQSDLGLLKVRIHRISCTDTSAPRLEVWRRTPDGNSEQVKNK